MEYIHKANRVISRRGKGMIMIPGTGASKHSRGKDQNKTSGISSNVKNIQESQIINKQRRPGKRPITKRNECELASWHGTEKPRERERKKSDPLTTMYGWVLCMAMNARGRRVVAQTSASRRLCR